MPSRTSVVTPSIMLGQGAPMKACVIGDTKMGGYGHALHRMWQLRDDVEVVGLADPDEAGRAKHAAEAQAKRTYADYREMLEKEKPQFVTIGPRCTNNHLEYLLACAEFGCHGMMEKPLTMDLAEADEAIAALDAKNLKWSVAFNFRASPVFQYLRDQLLQENLIGELLEIRSRGKEDHRAGGEDIIVLGIHLFDMMAEIMGAPLSATSSLCKDNGNPCTPADVVEATEPLGPITGEKVFITYRFLRNLPGTFASRKSKAGNKGRWGMDILGTEGMVTIRMAPVPEVYVLKDPSHAPAKSGIAWEPLAGAPEVDLKGSHVGHYAPIIDSVVDSVKNDTRPLCSIHDARVATEMIQAAWQSHVDGGAPASIPLKQRTHPLKGWTV